MKPEPGSLEYWQVKATEMERRAAKFEARYWLASQAVCEAERPLLQAHSILTLALMSEILIAKGFPVRNGYQHIELGVGFRNFELGDIDLGMVWITADEFCQDLLAFTNALDVELRGDGRIRTA